MPCNCPDDKSVPPVPQSLCAHLVHSGGPMSNLYRLVEHAIPDMEMVHGRPKVHPDGSLEFPGPPPTIPGYRPEGARLYPAWPPCTLRMLRVQVVGGVLCIAGLCGNPEAEQFSLEVAPDQCHKCPARRAQP
jgi:hypothetical protein